MDCFVPRNDEVGGAMTDQGRDEHPLRHCEARSQIRHGKARSHNPVIARRAAPWQSMSSHSGLNGLLRSSQ
jgi:hypothetical protein